MSPVQYPKLKVDSPNVKYSLDSLGHEQLESLYEYEHVRVQQQSPQLIQVSLHARTHTHAHTHAHAGSIPLANSLYSST